MQKFTAKNIRGKGRKISFTISSGDYSFTHTLVASFKLFSFLASLQAKEGSKVSTDEQFQLSMNLLKRLIGEQNYDDLLDYLEENAESIEEEAEVMANLIEVVSEKVLPKVQTSAEKA